MQILKRRCTHTLDVLPLVLCILWGAHVAILPFGVSASPTRSSPSMGKATAAIFTVLSLSCSHARLLSCPVLVLASYSVRVLACTGVHSGISKEEKNTETRLAPIPEKAATDSHRAAPEDKCRKTAFLSSLFCVCMRVYVCALTQIHALTLTHTHSHSQTHTHTHSHTNTHSHTLTRSHTYSHAHTHSHTHALTHTHTLALTHILTRSHTLTHSLTHTHKHRRCNLWYCNVQRCS